MFKSVAKLTTVSLSCTGETESVFLTVDAHSSRPGTLERRLRYFPENNFSEKNINQFLLNQILLYMALPFKHSVLAELIIL